MRGRKSFIAANAFMLLIDVSHTWGRFNPPIDSGEQVVRTSMQAYAIDMGLGLQASLWDVFQSLGFTMSVYLLAAGALNLWLLSFLDARRLRQLAFLNAGVAFVLTGLYSFYTITPPIVSYAAIGLAFVVAGVRIHGPRS